MCIMLYILKVIWFNAISYIYFQLEWGYMYPHYMCIVLYVIVIWCNDIAEIYCQYWRVDASSVYVHSAIYETYMVQCYSIHLFSIGVEQYIYSQYMCIMLYMKVIWFNAIPYIYFQLEWGVYVSSLYVHCAICDSYLV